MKKIQILAVIPICAALMFTPVSAYTAYAKTVDITDDYDAGLLADETDSKKIDYTAPDTVDETSSNASSSSSKASNAASKASSAANKGSSGASGNGADAASTAATTTTQTNDLPRTGDDDRVTVTFIAMLGSFSVFLIALFAGRIGKSV